MASSTKIKKIRKKMKEIRRGHQRKLALARNGTTPSWAVFFGDSTDSPKKTAG